MSRIPIRWSDKREAEPGRLKPYLLLALTVAVLAVYGTGLVR